MRTSVNFEIIEQISQFSTAYDLYQFLKKQYSQSDFTRRKMIRREYETLKSSQSSMPIDTWLEGWKNLESRMTAGLMGSASITTPVCPDRSVGPRTISCYSRTNSLGWEIFGDLFLGWRFYCINIQRICTIGVDVPHTGGRQNTPIVIINPLTVWLLIIRTIPIELVITVVDFDIFHPTVHDQMFYLMYLRGVRHLPLILLFSTEETIPFLSTESSQNVITN